MLVAIAVTAMMAVVFLVPLASLLVATAERAAGSARPGRRPSARRT